MNSARLSARLLVLWMGLVTLVFANTPQTHDVPMFHNDDGLGLLQDCELMRAIASGKITEIPTTVNARSTNCLASIKSVAQVLYSMQDATTVPKSCIPVIELNWFEVLDFVTTFMQQLPTEKLAGKTYGEWIALGLREKYPCA